VRRAGVILFVLGRSALRGLAASRVTTTVAVLTIAIALLLVGAFALVVGNMHGLIEHLGEELQVTAYLEAGLPQDDQRSLAERVATIEGVERVDWVSEQEAWERFRKSMGGATLLEGLDENPLPASLEIRLLPGHRTPEGLAILEESLDGLGGVDELSRGQQWVEGYARATALVRGAAIGLGGVLGVAALLIVANTIRLALYARKDELEILSLVGASRTFIRIPFLLEGTIQGLLGGLLAVALLYVAFQLFVPQMRYGLELILGNTEPRFFGGPGVLRLIISGGALGMLGSITALLGWRSR
jgi:cell division transport system permease protein